MLELQNICYRVSTPDGEQDILKNVSITIPDHKLVVFTGPNGGGKTTLAKVIMGLVQPTSGRVLYNGEDVTDMSITTVRTSRTLASPSVRNSVSATAFSSRRGSRASRSTTCCFWRRDRRSSARTSAART